MSHSNFMSISEAYTSIYEDTSKQNFLQLVDQLIEEGYDLSDYTYDELYEEYLNERLGALLPVLKNIGGRLVKATRGAAGTAWRGTTRTTRGGTVERVPGAKEEIKTQVAKLGNLTAKIAPWALLGASGLALNQAMGDPVGKVGNFVGGIGGGSKPPTASTEWSGPESLSPKVQLKILNGRVVGYKESYDTFDMIKDYLISEGYAKTEENALVIMANMSEAWKQNIIEQSNTLITPEQRRADELKYGMKRTTPVPPTRPSGAKVKPGSRMPL